MRDEFEEDCGEKTLKQQTEECLKTEKKGQELVFELNVSSPLQDWFKSLPKGRQDFNHTERPYRRGVGQALQTTESG